MKWHLILLSLAVAAVASAGTITVSPGQGWVFVNDKGAGGTGGFVTGPATPPVGNGSVEIAVNDSANSEMLETLAYGGVSFNSITDLTYSTYRSSGGSALALALQFDVDLDVTDTNIAYQGRAVYEPYYTHTVLDDTWQTWDTSQGADWWLSKAAAGAPCSIGSPCTWANLLTLYPNAGVLSWGGTMFKAGSGWPTFDGNVDNFTIGIRGTNTTIDFEAAPEPATWSLFAIGLGLTGLARRYRR